MYSGPACRPMAGRRGHSAPSAGVQRGQGAPRSRRRYYASACCFGQLSPVCKLVFELAHQYFSHTLFLVLLFVFARRRPANGRACACCEPPVRCACPCAPSARPPAPRGALPPRKHRTSSSWSVASMAITEQNKEEQAVKDCSVRSTRVGRAVHLAPAALH